MNTSDTRRRYALGFGLLAALIVALTIVGGAQIFLQIPEEARNGLLPQFLFLGGAFIVVFTILATFFGRRVLDAFSVRKSYEREMADSLSATPEEYEGGELFGLFAAMQAEIERLESESGQRQRARKECAQGYCQTMDEIAGGDLSLRLDTDVEDPVLSAIGTDFNEMMDELEDAVTDVYEFTGEVSESSEALTRRTEEAMYASMQVNRAARDIAAGGTGAAALEQFEEFEGFQEFDGFDDFEEFDTSGETLELAGDDRDVEIDETLAAIDRLSDRMDRIDEVSEFISDVATETNMLALNAGIEASKVQDGGAEGFQVVADEVKSLAEETKDSANEIDEITKDIRGGTNEAVSNILKQQAVLLSLMHEQAEDLATAADDLQTTLTRLRVSKMPNQEINGEQAAAGD